MNVKAFSIFYNIFVDAEANIFWQGLQGKGKKYDKQDWKQAMTRESTGSVTGKLKIDEKEHYNVLLCLP